MSMATSKVETVVSVAIIAGLLSTPARSYTILSASPGILSALHRNGCPRQIGIPVRATPVRAMLTHGFSFPNLFRAVSQRRNMGLARHRH